MLWKEEVGAAGRSELSHQSGLSSMQEKGIPGKKSAASLYVPSADSVPGAWRADNEERWAGRQYNPGGGEKLICRICHDDRLLEGGEKEAPSIQGLYGEADPRDIIVHAPAMCLTSAILPHSLFLPVPSDDISMSGLRQDLFHN